MDQLLSSDVLNNVKLDTLKFGVSAETGARLAKNGLSMEALTDPAWLGQTLLVILGFAVYQIVVRRLISTDFASGSSKMALDDILKVGTMLVFKQVASSKSVDSLRDASWQMNTFATLAGFVSYDFVTRHVYDTSALAGPLKASVDDALKFGTMFTVSNLITGGAFDADWAMVSGGYIAGLVAYNFLLSKI
jgi:hypothetical protein